MFSQLLLYHLRSGTCLGNGASHRWPDCPTSVNHQELPPDMLISQLEPCNVPTEALLSNDARLCQTDTENQPGQLLSQVCFMTCLKMTETFPFLLLAPFLVMMCLWQKGAPWCVMVEPVSRKTLKVYAFHIAQAGFILAIRTMKIYRLYLPSFTLALAGIVIQRPQYILCNRFRAIITGLDCVTCSHILE